MTESCGKCNEGKEHGDTGENNRVGGGVSSVLLEWTWHVRGALQDKEDLARHV